MQPNGYSQTMCLKCISSLQPLCPLLLPSQTPCLSLYSHGGHKASCFHCCQKASCFHGWQRRSSPKPVPSLCAISHMTFQTDMSSEAAWLTLCAQRSTFVSTLDGGISQMMNIILQSIFDSPLVDTICGFQLKSPSGDLRIHFTWSMMLCDGAAHKMVWTSKGDAGQKFCLLCANIRGMPASKEEEEPDEMYSSAMQYKDLVLVQDADVLASYQRLDARQKTCSKQEFQDWEKASGLSWSKHSILLNTRLIQKNLCKPVSQFVHDYMHGILQGTAPIVLWQTMNAIQACGLQVCSNFQRLGEPTSTQFVPSDSSCQVQQEPQVFLRGQ